MFLPFLLLAILFYGPQVVLSTIKLGISQVSQCEPVFVSFQGHLNSSFEDTPLTLEILPFNSTPTLIPLPTNAVNSSGVNVTFLPLPANTEFLASLIAPNGLSLSFVSDIFSVGAGPSSTCLPPAASASSFEIQNPGNITQCENFTISYSESTPPRVELFNPRLLSFPLKLVSHTNTTATYNMFAIRQTQVMMNIISTDGGRNQTSPLLTVQGDAFSPTSCFPKLNTTTQSMASKTQTPSPSKVSKGTIIGLSVGLGLAFLLAIPMVWFVIRERRRRSQIASVNFDASRMEKPSPSYVIPTFNLSEKNAPPPPFFGYPGYSEGKNIVNPSYVRDSYVRDPSYVSEKYSPTVSDYPRTSISWEYIRRNSADSRTRKVPNIDPELVDNLRTSVNTTNMLSSSNIEKMLDMAGRRRASEDAFGLHSPRSVISTNSYGFVPPSINSLPALAPAIPRRLSRHLSFGQRISPDVPRNLSFADSTFIVDRSMPLSESPESMGSRLQRPDSGAITTSSTGAMEEFTVVQPQKAVLLEAPPNPIQRSISPRTVSREDSLAKLVGAVPGGSRRTGSLGSRFSMDSLVAGGSDGQRSLENRYF